eukprot:8187755-Alexandrium_andersonii.AAC.1
MGPRGGPRSRNRQRAGSNPQSAPQSANPQSSQSLAIGALKARMKWRGRSHAGSTDRCVTSAGSDEE